MADGRNRGLTFIFDDFCCGQAHTFGFSAGASLATGMGVFSATPGCIG
jgi:hypothetical protein